LSSLVVVIKIVYPRSSHKWSRKFYITA